ncbi:MAG: hypothetical protein DWQ04_09825 [Chloroflexi bacterium]|nr:MAG: hypothetical protein DWQ04_09825 [Chloroflexota bacterium]
MDPENDQGNGQVVKIKLPQSLVQRLQNCVHPEKQSRFIVDAIEQRLSFEEQFTALEETAANWLQSNDQDILPEDEFLNWLNESGGVWNQAQQ